MRYTDQEKKDLIIMFKSPGWEVFEKWVRNKINICNNIPANTDLPDEEIVKMVKNARLKIDVYNGVLNNAKKEVHNGRK